MSHTSKTATTAAILKAQDQGYQGYLDGLHIIHDCPYDRHALELRQGWVRGYAASRTDRARANSSAADPTD